MRVIAIMIIEEKGYAPNGMGSFRDRKAEIFIFIAGFRSALKHI
jgi:hypothetical protein